VSTTEAVVIIIVALIAGGTIASVAESVSKAVAARRSPSAEASDE
jgi:hypothetical protein